MPCNKALYDQEFTYFHHVISHWRVEAPAATLPLDQGAGMSHASALACPMDSNTLTLLNAHGKSLNLFLKMQLKVCPDQGL